MSITETAANAAIATRNGSAAGAPGGEKGRSAAIYGIRGIAALGLMTVHVAMFAGLMGTKALDPPRPPTNFWGAFLVSGFPSLIGVFFVLPAMYLYLPLARSVISGDPRPPRGGSLGKRLFRLLPAYYAMCLVSLLAFNRDAIDGWGFFLRPFLLLQIYLPTPFQPKFINGMEVTWTVPSMVQWYIALPLIAVATHRFAVRGATPAIRARRLMIPVPILIAIGVGWLFFVKGQGWDNRMVFWWPQGFAPTIGIGVGLAILLALVQVSPIDTPKIFKAAAAHPHWFWFAAFVVYLINCARPFSVIGMDAIYTTSGLLVTYLMVAAFGLLASLPLIAPGARPHLVSNLLAMPPMAYLGRISYGIYLWHFAIMHFYLQSETILTGHSRPLREFYGTVGFWELEIATFIGSVIMASISYYFLEQPIAAWADRYFNQRRKRRAAASPEPSMPAQLPRALPSVEPVLTADEATAAVALATAERDAIQTNLLELEHNPGRQLLASANLAGQTKQRWEAATTDLTALWETFTAYSAVVDEANETMAGMGRRSSSDLAQVTSLLGGASIEFSRERAPLHERHITDNGRAHLTLDAAVAHMNELFGRTADLVSTTQTVWNEVSGRLEVIGADLGRARRALDDSAAAELAAAEAELARLRQLLGTDPLALWRSGQIDTNLDELQRRASALAEGPQPAFGGARRGASQSGSSHTGSSHTGPSHSGPSQSGPSQSGPSQSGPSQSGPSQSGPSQSGPSGSGPDGHSRPDGRAAP